jgi:hypothetical protein
MTSDYSPDDFRETALRMRHIRIILGIITLAISIALLIWGFLPPRREVRTKPISPTELQLPTPTSFSMMDMAFLSQPTLVS